MKSIIIVIMILLYSSLSAQTSYITGKVIISDSSNIENISIKLEGTKFKTLTNKNGDFEFINIPIGNYNIIIHHHRFEKQIIPVTVKQDQQTIIPPINLIEKHFQTNEVIVKGKKERRYNDTISSFATRTETRLIETAQSIQIINRDILNDQQAKTLNDVTKNAAGVSSVSPFNEFIFRGFTTWNATMYNGANGALFPYNVQAPTFNVEQVEFLRGPASVLYSSGRPGGLINMNTKKALSYQRYEVNLTYGSWNEMIAQIDATGPILKNKKLCYRFVTSNTYSESFRAFQKTKNIFITPSVNYRFNENTTLNLEYNYFYQQQAPGYDNGTIVRRNVDSTWNWKGMSLNFSAQSPHDKTVDKGHSIELNFKHAFSEKIKLTFINRYVYNYEEANNHSADYSDPIFTNDTIKRYYSEWQYPWHNYQSCLFTSFKFNTWKLKHQLLLGSDYSHQGSSYYHYKGAVAPSLNINNPDYSLDKTQDYNYFQMFFDDYSYQFQTTGFYFQEQIEINKYLKVSGGLRYDNYGFTYKYSYIDYTSSDSTKQWSGDTVKSHAIVPRIGIVYNPWRNIAFYGSYSESFEPQYLNSLKAGGPFQPTKGKTWEVGYKGDFINDKLSTSIALYSIDYLNVLVQDPRDSTGIRYMQVNGMNSKGVEFNVQGNITKNLQLILNYAYNNVVYFDSSSAWKQSDRQLNTPKVIYGAFLSYKFTKNTIKGLGANLGMHHESDRVASWTNQKFVTPAYTIFDLGVNYKIKAMTININLQNIFNTKYITGGYVTGLVYPGLPRSFRISLNYTI